VAVKLTSEITIGEQRKPPERPLTYEEFLAWADDKTFAEWVDGEVIVMSPVSLPHAEISLFLARLLSDFSEAHNLGQVLTAPFQMRLRNVERGREPDILFVAQEHLARLTHTFLDGPADLVVEIVSPESVLRDRGEKFAEYEIEGVREYWVVDPEQQRADFFMLGEDGRYERRRPDAQGIYHSVVLTGLWLNVNWLYQQPLPPLRDVLRELGLA
jgi:Uma2 family endonuclease